MDPYTNIPPEKPRRSLMPELLTGAGMGTIIGLITSLFNRRMTRLSHAGWGAAIGAALAGVLHAFGTKKEHQIPTVPPIEPPAAPPSPGQAHEFELARVPQILDLLVEQGAVTAPQKETVLGEIRNGRQGFAGEIAVTNGFTTKEQLESALLAQANRKAEAAIIDIATIVDFFGNTPTANQFDTMAPPRWLQANWGNNGVNPAPAAPTRVDGAAAAANNAQNLVMMAYYSNNPQLAATLQNGVIAAANLARGITQGDSSLIPLSKMSGQWIETMNKALLAAAQAAPDRMRDANGNPVNITQFIAARSGEINAAVTQTLQSPGKDQSPTR